MNLHEYQAKQLFAEYGLPVPDGYACDTPQEAAAAAGKIGGEKWVVKCQVHAGGRGKAGGVELHDNKEGIKQFAQYWLGKNLVTYQTDAVGQPVTKVLVEAAETYLTGLLDVPPKDAGLHLVGWLPTGTDDKYISQQLREHGIDTPALSSYSIRPLVRRALIMGYAAVTESEIVVAVKKMKPILERVLRT